VAGFFYGKMGRILLYLPFALSIVPSALIFLGGMEFDNYLALIERYAGEQGTSDFDSEVYGRILRERLRMLTPIVGRRAVGAPRSLHVRGKSSPPLTDPVINQIYLDFSESYVVY
jgi:hypothetical protein